MNCPSCGATIPDGSKLCSACHDPLGSVGARTDVTPETVSAFELQSAWQTSGSPSSSYESLGDAELTPATKAAGIRKVRGGVVAVVVTLLVVLLVGVGFVWGSGMLAEESTPEPPVADEPQTSSIVFGFNIPGIDYASSRIPIRITGTTAAGESYDHTFYVASMTGDVSEPIELEDGTYSVVAAGSPISSTGIVYDVDAARDEVTLVAANDAQVGSANLYFEPIAAADVTDEQIEAAYQWAAADEACTNADALRQAAYDRRAQAR